MNRFANSAEAPDFDAPQILRRTRRRRTTGIAAVAAALIVAGGGTALATSVAGGGSGSTPAATSTATSSDATTMLYLHPQGQTIPIDFAGWSLHGAKAYMEKTQTKLGTVTEKAVKGCKPGSVLGVSPHAPKTVKEGDTVSFTVCAG
ncbi:PASTA domain-containing protein [Streptomyces sp. Qhu-G9]|uniref:PASTA domain-containing protein n=1 Tax=Streptomyces sp. Qhu-G9 TaxID=3452799 RepID=UPI0022AC89DE|nr:PASTA domain-containing protein [Streptomyces aurantiacus]WAU79443.1 PASTA domain-containing protein [Streptomyces aurantiacus]